MAGRKPPLTIDVIVEAGDWPPPAGLRRLAGQAIGAAAQSAPTIEPESELSVVFTDDAHIRRLNRKFRGKDKVTNVLSFPAGGRNRLGPLLGDIFLALQTIQHEAADQGLTIDDHLTHLIVHGYLHLVGYDHETDAEALVMERLETAILRSLGIADPYSDDDTGKP